MEKLTVVFAVDQDSYATLWFNGVKKIESSGSMIPEDLLHMIADFVQTSGGVSEVKVHTYDLYEASTGDIPDSVNDAESLEKWYLETTGEELLEG